MGSASVATTNLVTDPPPAHGDRPFPPRARQVGAGQRLGPGVCGESGGCPAALPRRLDAACFPADPLTPVPARGPAAGGGAGVPAGAAGGPRCGGGLRAALTPPRGRSEEAAARGAQDGGSGG